MKKNLFIAIILVSVTLAVNACEPLPPPPPPPGAVLATAIPPPTATLAPVQVPIQQAFAASKHASTYVTGDGANNDCTRCHAPLNWIPTTPDDMPATCAACKFTIKVPKPVEKADWKNIECNVCHKVEKDTLTKQVAWLNAAVAQFDPSGEPYEAVQSNTDLCTHCHRDAHKIEIGKGAHASMGCTDCHDAHSTTANCADAKCHPNAPQPDKPIASHDAAHANVNCVACHDANGWKVEPTGDKKIWLTLKPMDHTGKPNPVPFASHNLQKQVDCARCHFAGNPWNLKPGK